MPVARAAASLSEMTGYRIMLEVPQLTLLDIKEVGPRLGWMLEGNVACVNQVFSGSISGNALLVMEQSAALVLSQLINDVDSRWDAGNLDHRETDDARYRVDTLIRRVAEILRERVRTTDIVARLVAQKYNEAWGQPVIVDNRPGVSGILGANIVAKAPPNGYTLFAAWLGVLTRINPLTYAVDPMRRLVFSHLDLTATAGRVRRCCVADLRVTSCWAARLASRARAARMMRPTIASATLMFWFSQWGNKSIKTPHLF